MGLLKRLHIALYAYAVKWYRTRHAIQVFKQAHAAELTKTPVSMWPMTMARQSAEMQAVRAGRLDAGAPVTDRKSWQWPFLPASVQRLSIPIMKSTPYNLRRMSRTPVPRRAMNLIKGALIAQPWDIRSIEDTDPMDNPDMQQERSKIVRKVFSHPNHQDSFQTFVEQGLEDMITLGAFVTELRLTVDPERPLKMWPVNIESIRIFASWSESTLDMPRYAQMTGLKGERGAVLFYDDELMYVKDNPSTDNPFGLGKMEVAFQSVNSFLGVQDMAGRAGTDQVHKTFLWWEAPQNQSHYEIVRRHIQNELEGQAKLSIIGGMKKPEVVEVTPVNEADLLLNWQELLIRMIANAFDMSAMALGVEHDVNRAVGEVLDDKDFRSAVVPVARRLQEAFTRKIIHELLGWYDLEFAFMSLDDPDAQTKIDMFSKMYSMNSITPNEIRKGMNRRPLKTPFAELTQVEAMIANLEAMGMQQSQMQKQAADRQQDMMKQQQALMPPSDPNDPNQPPGGGGGFAPKIPSAAPVSDTSTKGIMRAPRKLSLPKFPIAGSKYNAQQIARMPVNQVQDIWTGTGMRMSDFLNQMDTQEPGILRELTDDLKQFVEQELQDEQKKKNSKIPPRLLKQWQSDLATKVRKANKRPSDYSRWMQDKKGNPGRSTDSAGVGNPRPVGGRPGNLNPIHKG